MEYISLCLEFVTLRCMIVVTLIPKSWELKLRACLLRNQRGQIIIVVQHQAVQALLHLTIHSPTIRCDVFDDRARGRHLRADLWWFHRWSQEHSSESCKCISVWSFSCEWHYGWTVAPWWWEEKLVTFYIHYLRMFLRWWDFISYIWWWLSLGVIMRSVMCQEHESQTCPLLKQGQTTYKGKQIPKASMWWHKKWL